MLCTLGCRRRKAARVDSAVVAARFISNVGGQDTDARSLARPAGPEIMTQEVDDPRKLICRLHVDEPSVTHYYIPVPQAPGS
jgi:hypothetical protein